MGTEENKAAVRETFAAMDREHNMRPLAEKATDDYVGHFPGMPIVDRGTLQAIGNAFYAAFPDLSHTLDEVIGEGETVSVRMTIRGTHKADFVTAAGAIPPTGKSIELHALNMLHIKEGKTTEQWIVFDPMEMMGQLGLA